MSQKLLVLRGPETKTTELDSEIRRRQTALWQRRSAQRKGAPVSHGQSFGSGARFRPSNIPIFSPTYGMLHEKSTKPALRTSRSSSKGVKERNYLWL